MFIVGLVFIIVPNKIVGVALVVSLSLVLFAYGIVRFIGCFKSNDLTQGVVTVILCFSGGFALLTVHSQLSQVAALPCILVGAVSMLIGLLRLLICVNCARNHVKGAVRNGISAFLCIAFALFLIIHPILNFGLMVLVAGCYFLFYALTLLFDFIAEVSRSDLDEEKISRRLHFALPNLITAVQPAKMIKSINKGRSEGKISGGMLIEQKPNAEYKDVNVEIMVHLTTQGANKFGHVDLAIKDKVYSYGTYDSSTVKMGGFVAQGTFIIVPKIPYLKYCLDYQQKYVIGFGAHLSDKQLQSVRNNIEAMLADCEPYESPYEKAVKNGDDASGLNDPASNLVRDVGGRVYTVTQGQFKRYFGINTNCVKVADWLLTGSGIDRLTFNGISTPGGYYSMLENMFRRANTRIIRKTSYIVADEIDDLEELRELARQAKAEMEAEKKQKNE